MRYAPGKVVTDVKQFSFQPVRLKVLGLSDSTSVQLSEREFHVVGALT